MGGGGGGDTNCFEAEALVRGGPSGVTGGKQLKLRRVAILFPSL